MVLPYGAAVVGVIVAAVVGAAALAAFLMSSLSQSPGTGKENLQEHGVIWGALCAAAICALVKVMDLFQLVNLERKRQLFRFRTVIVHAVRVTKYGYQVVWWFVVICLHMGFDL